MGAFIGSSWRPEPSDIFPILDKRRARHGARCDPSVAAVGRGCAIDAELCGEFSNTNRSHDERAAIPDMLDPIVIESVTKNGSADRPGQMGSALAPVETGAAEPSAPGGETKID